MFCSEYSQQIWKRLTWILNWPKSAVKGHHGPCKTGDAITLWACPKENCNSSLELVGKIANEGFDSLSVKKNETRLILWGCDVYSIRACVIKEIVSRPHF